MKTDVIVIGAGIGGLSAAIRLAAHGYRVTLLEKLDRPGGKMGEVRAEGFRWDTGPSVITMRHVYEGLFADAGRDLRDYLDLVPLQPITRYFWRDGATIDAVADEEAMCENIRRAFGPRDVDGYRRFMRYTRRLYEVVSGPFLYRQKPTLRDLASLPVGDVLRIDALRTMHQAIRAHFRDPHLVQLFDRFATYNGSSPYRAPATLNVIAYVEMAQGAWYPRGGIFRLARAWERLASELGVELRYNSPAQEICIASGRACGVRLMSGETIRADAVVCNVDYTWARETLIPDRARRKDTPEPSCSGFVLLLGIRGAHDALAHHNIFFTPDYRREFDDIFVRRIAPRDPTLYVCITSKTDPDHAPPGCENWFVLINAPYLSEAYDWRAEAERYAQHIKGLLVANLGRIAPLSDAQGLVQVERRLTPLDLQATYGGHQGAIYGFSSNTRTAAFMRPGNRDGTIGRLYFASGSVHPGGGVPLVTLSGIAAAQCVEEDSQ
ncbi:MAG: phytoene desaturase [Chloroflexi bacterium]|jgi:phytoene desaturase|uniref:4,4'-diaponeurosporene oxygenase n=1 Tax=Candidatus Thermofonsia Clade 3 bacterium TaxID=2364212 RepID=A0A2M8QE61_9CHLR|nr:phytoene desaturase family protein [Candidatus Roseilinea sp. NK_OTU-006]PJF48091.1 MAG: phytoene desaturase [Candidatus Thermofonsia Clade 3 bacterium]RMG63922.1 MAG: phytoene desaturase [Chloroflexota bacterium]